jgi:hypothetical protein
MAIPEKKKFGGLLKLSHAQLVDRLIEAGSADLSDFGRSSEKPMTETTKGGIGLGTKVSTGIVLGGIPAATAFGGDGQY